LGIDGKHRVPGSYENTNKCRHDGDRKDLDNGFNIGKLYFGCFAIIKDQAQVDNKRNGYQGDETIDGGKCYGKGGISLEKIGKEPGNCSSGTG
jgi:hypothetical protein